MYYVQKYSTTKNKIPGKEIFQIIFAIQFSIFVVKHTSTCSTHKCGGKIFELEILYCAGIFKQSMGAWNRVGMGLSYWPARLHSLTELVPWNRFLGSLKV
jgi:hypothetical protein